MNKHIEIDEIVDRVYDMLFRQKFADWYSDDGNFARHIQGDLPKVEKETIIEDLKKMLRVA